MSHMIASAIPPLDPQVGMAYFNTTVKKLYVYNGHVWLDVGTEPIVTEDMLWNAVQVIEVEKLALGKDKP